MWFLRCSLLCACCAIVTTMEQHGFSVCAGRDSCRRRVLSWPGHLCRAVRLGAPCSTLLCSLTLTLPLLHRPGAKTAGTVELGSFQRISADLALRDDVTVEPIKQPSPCAHVGFQVRGTQHRHSHCRLAVNRRLTTRATQPTDRPSEPRHCEQ